MLSEKTLKNGDDIEFQLKDAQGKAIASQKVNISFEANGKYENYSVMTDKDGKFYLVLTNEELGDHKVVVNYYGDNKYNPSKWKKPLKSWKVHPTQKKPMSTQQQAQSNTKTPMQAKPTIILMSLFIMTQNTTSTTTNGELL